MVGPLVKVLQLHPTWMLSDGTIPLQVKKEREEQHTSSWGLVQHLTTNLPKLLSFSLSCDCVAVVYPAELSPPFWDSWPLSLATGCHKMLRVLVNRHTIMIWQTSSKTYVRRGSSSSDDEGQRCLVFLNQGSLSPADVSYSVNQRLRFMSLSWRLR